MAQDSDSINARLNALVADYRRQLPEQLRAIESLFATVLEMPDQPASLEALYRALHKLAGSGATFGYTEMGKIARQWERTLHPLFEGQITPSSQKCDEMQSFLKQILQAATIPDEN